MARGFVERYKKQYGRDAMHFTAVSYDTLALIDHIARSEKPFSQETLESLKSWKGIAFETQILPEGECAIPLFTILHQDGEKVVLE
ncbi:MAG: hypothetical protein JRF69_09350 [Deltaproteobacteria bacterium]|nr:hypothetical protein [Deltaproteobacteria bacterium]